MLLTQMHVILMAAVQRDFTMLLVVPIGAVMDTQTRDGCWGWAAKRELCVARGHHVLTAVLIIDDSSCGVFA